VLHQAKARLQDEEADSASTLEQELSGNAN
jgi:hypothetical protein